jgi:PRTRC genetic system protein A
MMTGTPLKLVGHMLMEQPTLPPMLWPYGYVVAANGVFVWARRQGLEALIPITHAPIGGLYPIEPFVRLTYPPVDTGLVSETLRLCREARTPSGDPLEILFYLAWDDQWGWRLTLPVQEQQATCVTPVIEALDHARYANTLLEIHSHHRMGAFFSETDTADEQGFRLYGVVGRLDDAPEIHMRVGIYGQFWDIPASTILSLPSYITDCVVRDQLWRGGGN